MHHPLIECSVKEKTSGARSRHPQQQPGQAMTTGYMLFANANRRAVLERRPGLKVTEVAQALGEMWRALPEEERKRLSDQAAELRRAAPPRQPKAKEAKEAKARAKAGKGAAAPRPKRPLSGFMKFSQAKRADVLAAEPGVAFGEVGKRLGAMWRGLSADEKARW